MILAALAVFYISGECALHQAIIGCCASNFNLPNKKPHGFHRAVFVFYPTFFT
jgi:hypothetical protein